MNISSTPPYEWIFSGIGVAVVFWLGTWAYRRYHRVPVSKEHPESSSQVKIAESTVIGPVAGRDISIGTLVQPAVAPEPSNDEYREKPTAIEIAEAIERVPLYLRNSVALSYSGIKIRWQMQISNIHLLRDGQVDLILGISDKVILNISGRAKFAVIRVKLDEYPILKTVHGGELVEVLGTIDWVQENALVHLKDAKLKFLP